MLDTIPGSKGSFPNAKILITSLEDARIAWDIIAEKIEYEVQANGPMITLRITTQLPKVELEHVDVKMEQSDESSGRVCANTEDLEDETEDNKAVGEEATGGENGRNITYIDVKEEESDEGDEKTNQSVEHVEVSTGDNKNRPIVERKKTEVSSATNSPDRSHRQPPATRIVIKFGKNIPKHIRPPKQSRQPLSGAKKGLKTTTEEIKGKKKHKKHDGNKRTGLTQGRVIIQDNFREPGVRPTRDGGSQRPLSDCRNDEVEKNKAKDGSMGPELRLGSHGEEKCSVQSCATISQGKVSSRDEFGEPGQRCVRHGGGKRCSVRDCKNSSVGGVTSKDEFG